MASILDIRDDPSTPPTALSAPPLHTEFMVGWICVLKEEYRAAVSVLDERYDAAGLIRGQGDRNHYVLGRVGGHHIMINLPPAEMYGQTHASRIAIDMKSTFPRIRCVLLVGIAGGAPSPKHDIRLGDVVLGTRVVPYATGKETDDGFERTGMVRTPPRELLEAITFLEERMWSEDLSLSESIERIRAKTTRGQTAFLRPANDRLYKDGFLHQETVCDCLQPESQQQANLIPRRLREGDLVQLFKGSIGSDNRVMKNAQTRNDIAKREKILCYEMEAAAVMEITPCLPIQGISNYADGHKNDDWCLYAALAAAVCARELLLSISPQIVAQYPLTLSGTLLDRYITDVARNPHAFSSNETEKLRQNRNSLIERHPLIEELLKQQLRKMEDGSDGDIEDVQNEVKRLQDLQATLKRHLDDLGPIMDRHNDLLLSHDAAVRDEYTYLQAQVQMDSKAMEDFAVVAQSSLQTTGKMLKLCSLKMRNKE
ncbi:uncharacterized protein ACLA_006840 [Aspergillus clavatus NRRL 1]|uniref:Nucleoside phosphorylase domain-containing protein n=1 Tax=Aspergillus clavatus (strain ATCC 1007 / CBS 513.65 / DSM 816 / NCTC 3887 / NRRL 1 / QM 1276 / 107) TaxID=344612 RepID=A1CDJ9_ASPCL|nr:uncharacterized protein ACLA_006840 [Aspergillus clavatus NRRL 1]EAW11926.1 conserved hypothetical protein [Aspergillus clavatus NRRL 1]